MSLLLFFDVETTGIDKVNDRIVQIAWILADTNGESLIERSFILRSDGYKIPGIVSKIHGITDEISMLKGVERASVFSELAQTCANVSRIVAHNINFDIAFLRAECIRLKQHRIFDSVPLYCTMTSSSAYCALPHLNGRAGIKWPRLEELHYRLFGRYFSGAHDAMVDTRITKKCYFELLNRGVIDHI